LPSLNTNIHFGQELFSGELFINQQINKRIQMPKITLTLIIFLLLFSQTLSREKIRPEYDFKDSSFSLIYNIDIPEGLTDDDILSILFKYELVKQYSAKTNVKITLLEEKNSTNKIRYAYNYLVAKLEIDMAREKSVSDKKVSFKMTKYQRSAKIIPDVLSAGGTYQIINNGKTLLYKQQTVMNKEINGVYTHFIKRDVQAYLKEIMSFLYVSAQNK
jgi:hypothetical protein